MSKIVKELTEAHKRENEKYFRKVIEKCAKIYVWKDIGETFRMIDGKLCGTKEGVRAIKNITPPSFHSKIVLYSSTFN